MIDAKLQGHHLELYLQIKTFPFTNQSVFSGLVNCLLVFTLQTRSQVRQMDRVSALKDLAIAELEVKLQALEFSTHNGVFIWKIGDFSRRRQDAKSQRSPAIFSPGWP